MIVESLSIHSVVLEGVSQAPQWVMLSPDVLARLMGVALLVFLLSIQTLMFGMFIWYVLWLAERSADRGVLKLLGRRAPQMLSFRVLGLMGFVLSVALLATGTAFHLRDMNVEWTQTLLLLTFLILIIIGLFWLIDTAIVLFRKARARFGSRT